MKRVERPPLGVKPRWAWEEERASDLSEAMQRYLDAGVEIPEEWNMEFNELYSKIMSKKTEKNLAEQMREKALNGNEGCYDRAVDVIRAAAEKGDLSVELTGLPDAVQKRLIQEGFRLKNIGRRANPAFDTFEVYWGAYREEEEPEEEAAVPEGIRQLAEALGGNVMVLKVKMP